MTLGIGLLGDDLLGYTAPPMVPGERVVPETQALLLDPATRDFVRDAQGFYVGLHPVDARVTLKVTTVAGSITNSSDLGQKLAQFKYMTPDLETSVKYEIKRALADELAGESPNITLDKITVERLPLGGYFVEVAYYNNLLPKQNRVRSNVRVALSGSNSNPKG